LVLIKPSTAFCGEKHRGQGHRLVHHHGSTLVYIFIIIMNFQQLLLFLINFKFCFGFDRNIPRLGIDYGPRLIGIAISNRLGLITPLTTIQNERNLTAISNQITDMAVNQGISEIILGIPLDQNGRLSYKVKNFNGGLCLDFSRVLASVIQQRHSKCRVYLVDERFSTREAKEKLKQVKIKASIDAMSAVCLIERFVEDEGEYALQAEPCEYPPPPELEILDYNRVSEHIKDLYSENLTPAQITQRRMQAIKVKWFVQFS
jgi:putative Holliday junction resolvase